MHSESSGLVATSTLKFVEGLSFFLLKAVIETEINKKIQIDLRAAPSYFMYLSWSFVGQAHMESYPFEKPPDSFPSEI